MSSTNNLKVIRENGLNRLEKRSKYNVLKFSNKTRSREPDHIARKSFENYSSSPRLKRSSFMQFDKNIRPSLGLEHSKFFGYQEPHSISPPIHSLAAKVVTNLLEPFNKKKRTSVIEAKELKATE